MSQTKFNEVVLDADGTANQVKFTISDSGVTLNPVTNGSANGVNNDANDTKMSGISSVEESNQSSDSSTQNGVHNGQSQVPGRRVNKHEAIATLVAASNSITVGEFVRKHDGKREITKVLIANNGIAAVKCMRSVRKWCNEVFRNERAIKFVVMVTPDDLAANAEYIKMADQVYPVPGGPNRNNYANVELITEVAIRTQAHAVWAGWGHASENPALPENLALHDICFLGPPPSAMFALGDKIASTIIAQTVGVHTLPWSGDSVKLDLPSGRRNMQVQVPSALFEAAQVFTAEEALVQARRIGFPVMIKASAGGGGKGIRRAEEDNEEAFALLFNQVRNEVSGSPIFIMKYASNVRHLEVQVLADQYGEAISVFGRDCTLQRRHQKIIEEAPITIVQDASLLREMETKARELAKLVGYVSAGTVEYMYDLDRNDYYFLELNPRLQVEHPCTEMLTDLNFPACQLQIAMGLPLHRIKEVRALYREDVNATSRIAFDNPRYAPEPRGHVIAARITCENPDEGFKPESGALQELNFRAAKHAWAYFSVPASGGSLHQFADSQFGHVFASGANRVEARNNMVVALKELCIRGDFRTTTEFLVGVLGSYAFEANLYSTSWLDKLISDRSLVKTEQLDRKIAVVCCALHIADRCITQLMREFKNHLERGQVLSADSLKTSVEVELIHNSVKFNLTVVKTGTTANLGSQYFLISNHSSLEADVLRTPDSALLTTFDGGSYTSYFKELPDVYRISIGNKVCDFQKQCDPTALRVNSSGRLLQFLVQEGQHVQRGQAYAEMEVMKLVQTLHAHENGKIELLSRAGAILESGAVIARLALDNPEKVRTVEQFTGNLFDRVFRAPQTSTLLSEFAMHGRFAATTEAGNRTSVPGAQGQASAGGRRTPQRRLSLTPLPSNAALQSLQQGGDTKVNHTFQQARQSIENLLRGYCLPEPYLKQQLRDSLSTLFACLGDPRLPFCEMQDLLAQVSGRVPDYLEKQMRAEMQTYAANITSMLCVFPASKLALLIDRCALESFKRRADRDAFYQTMEGIIALIERFKHDLRGHMRLVVQHFLHHYLNVELDFQAGLFEKCVLALLDKYSNRSTAKRGAGSANMSRERFRAKALAPSLESGAASSALTKATDAGPAAGSEMDYVVDVIVSHSKVAQKNMFVISLLEELWERDAFIVQELRETIEALTSLSNNNNMKVALKARQLLIAATRPPYELRYNQMESIFLNTVSSFGRESCSQSLRKLIYAEASIFDILGEFFYHSNLEIRKASLEVYIRRSYVAYDLYSLQHHFVDQNNLPYVEFRFVLPSSHPNRVQKRKTSTSSLQGFDRESSRAEASYAGSAGNYSPSKGSSGTLPRSMSDKNIAARNTTTSAAPSAAETSWTLAPGAAADAAAEQDEDARLICEQLFQTQLDCHRIGVMVAFSSGDELQRRFTDVLDLFECRDSATQDDDVRAAEHIHIINAAVCTTDLRSDDYYAAVFGDLARKYRSEMDLHGIRRITFIVLAQRHFPKFFSFRSRDNYQEDLIYRHLEPALAFQLEINRMNNFDLEPIWTPNRRIYVYMAKSKAKGREEQPIDYRLFARCMIRNVGVVDAEAASFEILQSEAEKDLLETMDSLEMAFSHPLASRTDCNHIFLNFVPRFTAEPDMIQEAIRNLVLRYGTRLWKLRVQTAEVRLLIRPTATTRSFAIRLTVTNESGYALDIATYTEHRDTRGQVVFQTYPADTPKPGPLHGLPLATLYSVRDALQKKRFTAQSLSTTYVYDYPKFFRQVIYTSWTDFLQKAGRPFVADRSKAAIRPAASGSRLRSESFAATASTIRVPNLTEILQCEELVMDDNEQLQRVTRPAGLNDCGIVAWLMRAYTPEYDTVGREFVVIANDITYQIGSVGPREHALYNAATQLARQLRVPRIYIACNSGARIGLAEEIKALFRIEWNDPTNPERGVRYLYLTEDDYTRLGASVTQSVHCERIVVPVDDDSGSQVRYRITAVIGKQDGLGVESLKGSALVAGETARAYNEIVTMGVVTCRTVGIGAYLIRLGRRVVQIENSHIILTGSHALNKVLGKQVYTSNQQLGGIQIMYANGVTYDVVANDRDAIGRIVEWLSYVPRARGEPLPVLPLICDTLERDIEFVPTRTPYDPRWMLAGKYEALEPAQALRRASSTQTEVKWISGFFDKDSFHELMAGWAPTVIAGRARLGGIPCAVLAVETRQVEVTTPADPANPSNSAQTYTQAGQVWFPDSAFKSSEAIEDFKREDLPLFVFANWRGFSGGMKDMYNEILKFGAMIVESLVGYRQPVLIYIVPNGELRGGAWAVLDPSINPAFMELYADVDCRGGVLEPDGVAEIKFRERDLITLMNREDSVCASLVKRLKALSAGSTTTTTTTTTTTAAQPAANVALQNTAKEAQSNTTDESNTKNAAGEQSAAASVSVPWPKSVTQPKDTRSALEAELKQRHQTLLHSYHQAALMFIDLHDGCDRMMAKGTITAAVQWRSSRRYFYWRLRRLLAEFDLVFRVEAALSVNAGANPSNTIQRSPAQTDVTRVLQARALVKQWFIEFHRTRLSNQTTTDVQGSLEQRVQAAWEDNQLALSWFDAEIAFLADGFDGEDESFIARKLRECEAVSIGNEMRQLTVRSADAVLDACSQMLQNVQWLTNNVQPSTRERCIAMMRELIDNTDKPLDRTYANASDS